MKNTLLLAIVALASSALAKVTLYTNGGCDSSVTGPVDTVSGTCYTVTEENTWFSASGCSANHDLRIHKTTDCSDNEDGAGGEVAGGCAGIIPSAAIGSFKCVLV